MIEAGFVLLIIVIIFGAFLILRSIKNFIINAVVGLVILFLANQFAGLDIGYSWLVILICGIGGILGAFLAGTCCAPEDIRQRTGASGLAVRGPSGDPACCPFLRTRKPALAARDVHARVSATTTGPGRMEG